MSSLTLLDAALNAAGGFPTPLPASGESSVVGNLDSNVPRDLPVIITPNDGPGGNTSVASDFDDDFVTIDDDDYSSSEIFERSPSSLEGFIKRAASGAYSLFRRNGHTAAEGPAVGSPQKNAPLNLVKISSKVRPAPATGNFHYPEGAGKGIRIIIMDSGINLEHPQAKGFIKNGGKFDKPLSAAIKDPGRIAEDPKGANPGHGSNVWQYAASPKWGTAKKVTIQMVVIDSDDEHINESADRGFELIEDLIKKTPNVKTIINLSMGLKPTDDTMHTKWINHLKAFDKMGALIMTSAGNDGFASKPKDLVSEQKCQWKKEIPNLLLIGLTDKDDKKSDFSSRDPGEQTGDCVIDLWAFAEELDIIAATGTGMTDDPEGELGTGSSFACPQGAGVGATIWEDKGFKTAAEVKAHMLKLAKDVQKPNGLPLLWNGHEPGATADVDGCFVKRGGTTKAKSTMKCKLPKEACDPKKKGTAACKKTTETTDPEKKKNGKTTTDPKKNGKTTTDPKKNGKTTTSDKTTVTDPKKTTTTTTKSSKKKGGK